jgi:REP element-mobilizing transposase RayT
MNRSTQKPNPAAEPRQHKAWGKIGDSRWHPMNRSTQKPNPAAEPRQHKAWGKIGDSRWHPMNPMQPHESNSPTQKIAAVAATEDPMSTYSNLLFHIVFSSKYRRNLIDDVIQTRLYEYIGGIIREQKGILLEIGGMPDHIHILTKLSPSIAISDVLRATKANSSKWVSETFPTKKEFAWQRGFGAFSVSVSNVDQVRRYIQNQKQHHMNRSFQDEFRDLLVKHGIEFEEKYLFEIEAVG